MLCVALIGLVLDQGLLRFVRGFELRQVLLTLGVAFVLNDLALVIWGGDTFTVPIPEMLQGAVRDRRRFYPKYRLFVLLVGMLVFIGALAAAQPHPARRADPRRRRRCRDGRSHGHQHPPGLSRTFMLGASLAGLGRRGGRSVPYALSDGRLRKFSFLVWRSSSSAGGGSLVGAAVGALLVGLLNTFGQVLFPELAYFVIFGPMAVMLAFRPLGLFGRAA